MGERLSAFNMDNVYNRGQAVRKLPTEIAMILELTAWTENRGQDLNGNSELFGRGLSLTAEHLMKWLIDFWGKSLAGTSR